MHVIVDGMRLAYAEGDSLAMAILRAGQQPHYGGCLCLAGDCPNCVAEVDGVAYVRTCQTPCRPGTVVRRHPAVGPPPLEGLRTSLRGPIVTKRSVEADVVVIGAGESGRAEAARMRAAGAGEVLVLDAADGHEVVGIYAGPTVLARTLDGLLHVHALDVVVATGAAELHPVCPGSRLAGLVTLRAATKVTAAGVDLGVAVLVGAGLDVGAGSDGGAGLDGGGPRLDASTSPWTVVTGELVRFLDDGTGRVGGVAVRGSDGAETTHACQTAVVDLGLAARDVLSRMAGPTPVRVVGSAAGPYPLPPCPTAGVVCPCAGVTVEDLHGVWDRGFTEMELVKRASLAGTGTCQGAVCVPHVRAFIAAQTGEIPMPFTARPASRQLTLGEVAAGVPYDAWKRTPLHEEHLKLGAHMDRWGGWWRPWHYGDHVREYWAVREAVSLGDVSTLGKLIVSGPDAVELLERLYPTSIADIRPGRSRYVLLLNERGHVIDDGMVCRESDTRFVLTFTSSGAANAEMWIRDWIETWGLDVRVMDRTMALAAINVTGPFAGELLRRCGVNDIPKFLQHRREAVAGVPCHVMRLSFTGEASFELHHDWDRAPELWRALLDAGRPLGVRPHGLQALFGLRLEKGHVIVGADTELDTTPRRIGMDWAVKMDKSTAFIGRTALARTADLPDHRRQLAFTMHGSAPIEGTPIFVEGDVVGYVSSTFASPLLGHTVMLGWIKQPSPGAALPREVVVDGRTATAASLPFYDPDGARARL